MATTGSEAPRVYPVLAATLFTVLAIAPGAEPTLGAGRLPALDPTMTPRDPEAYFLDEVPLSRSGLLSDSLILDEGLSEGLDADGIAVLFVVRPSLCWTLLDEIHEFHELLSAASVPGRVEMAIVLDAESQETAERWYNSTALGMPVITGVQRSAMQSLARYRDQEFQAQLVVYDARAERVMLRAALVSLTPEESKRPVVEAVVRLLTDTPDHAFGRKVGGTE